jgi:DNA-binding MarR family transcriptional regulator
LSSEKERLIQELSDEFRRNGNQSFVFDTAAARRLGINLTDLQCLDVAQRRGGVTAGELATEMGLTTGAITGVIDRLERAGYARRVRDSKDRRRVLVEVSPEFHEVAWTIWAPLAGDWQAQMRTRTVKELNVILDFMREGNEMAEQHIARLRDEADAG